MLDLAHFGFLDSSASKCDKADRSDPQLASAAMLSGMPLLLTASLLALLSLEVPGASAFSVTPAASSNRDLRGLVGHCPLRPSHVLGMRAPLPSLLQAQRKRGAVAVGMLLGVQSRYSPKKVLPLITGGNLVVGTNGWFLEGVEGGEELFGDQATPLHRALSTLHLKPWTLNPERLASRPPPSPTIFDHEPRSLNPDP